jgi:hypothetical protein
MRTLLAGLAAVGVVLAAAETVEARRERDPVLPRAGSIRGYMLDPAGQPITGVIGLRTAGDCLVSLHHSDSGRDGLFVLENLAPGVYTISVEAVSTFAPDLRSGNRVSVEVFPGRVSRPVIVPHCEPRVRVSVPTRGA